MPTTRKPIPAPAVGVYENVPSEIYHAWNCANASSLKAMIETTPHHVHFDRNNPEETPDIPPSVSGASLDIGTAWHTLCLQPDEFQTYVVELPELDFRKKDDKEWFANVKASRADFPTVYLRKDSAEVVRNMAAALRANKTAANLLDLPGRCELSVVWETRSATGRLVKVKARYDKILDPFDGSPCVLLDLKSTMDASPKAFQKDIAERRYHWSAGLYSAIARECPDLPNPEGFVLLAQEKDRDFQAACYSLDPAAVSLGEVQVREALDIWADCEASGVWPAYHEGLKTISLPLWAMPKVLA